MDKQTWTNVNKRGGCLIIRFERIEQSLVSRRYIKCEIHLYRLFSSLPPPLPIHLETFLKPSVTGIRLTEGINGPGQV